MATRTLNVAITGDARSVNRALDQTEARTKKWGGAMAKSFAVVGAAAAGGLAVGLKKSADAAIEAEKAQATMVAQLRASGISYKAHAKQIDEVIQKHSKLSGLDDEDLQRSFTNIVRVTGDVDKSLRLTGLAADFARAKHMDVAKAGELVGKVAGGNTGILSRYGIQIEKGATASEALALLQRKFAGQAEAYGKTTAGSLDRAQVASENLGETVGAKLTPLLAKAADGLVSLVDQAGKLGGPIREASGVVGNAFNRISGAVKKFREDNRESIDTVIKAGRNLGVAIRYVFEEVMLPVIRTVIRRIVPILDGLKDTIGGMIRFVSNILTGQWGKAWDAAKDTVSAALRTVKNIIVGAGDVLWTAVKALGGTIIKGLVAGLKGLGGAIKDAVVDGVKAGVEKAKGAIGDVLSFLNPFGDGIGRVAKNIGDGVGKSVSSMGRGANLMGADQDLFPFAAAAARAGLRTTSGLRPGSITSTGNTSYHSSGDAIDVSGSPGAMLGFFQQMKKSAGSKLRELIYTPGGAGIKDGHPFRYSGQVAADHYDHVHLAYTGPFGDGIGQAVNAARAAGFRGQSLINAVAIAGAESRYDADAQNLKYPDHSIGMWQINQLAHHGRYGSDAALKNPFTNAKAAWAISGGGRNFGPWSTWPTDARSWMDRARAAVQGTRGGGSASGGGGGGGGGTQRESITVSMPQVYGSGRSLGYAGELVRAETGEKKARATDNLGKLISSWKRQRDLKAARLRLVRKVLSGRITRARRIRLLGEEGDLVGEIDALDTNIKEFSADRAGGATTISGAEALEAGVAPDTGGGGGGGEAAQPDPNIALLAQLTGEMVANQRRLIALAETQGPTIVGAVVAAVNGSIGGRVGMGFQGIRSAPGSVAGL